MIGPRILCLLVLLAMAASSGNFSYAQAVPQLAPSTSTPVQNPSLQGPPPASPKLVPKPDSAQEDASSNPLPPEALDLGLPVTKLIPSLKKPSDELQDSASATPTDYMPFGTIVGRWGFSRLEDKDYDGWPDGWQRQKDRNHPAYLKLQVVANDEAWLKKAQAADMMVLNAWPKVRKAIPNLSGLPPSVADWTVDRYFRAELNGGSVMVQSPMVPVDSLYRFQLELVGRSESLVHDHAYAELVFFSNDGRVVAQHATPSLRGTTPWTPLSSALLPVPKSAVKAAVRLIVRPINAVGEFDINGAAGFDGIMIRRLPEMRITTDHPMAIYDVGTRPEVSVRVFGLDRKTASMHFIVKDVFGRKVTEETVSFLEIVAPPDDLLEQTAPADSPSSLNKSLARSATSDGDRTPIGLEIDPTATKNPSETLTSDVLDPVGSQLANPSLDVLNLDGVGLEDSGLEALPMDAGSQKSKPISADADSPDRVPSRPTQAIEGVAIYHVPVLRPGYYVVESVLGGAGGQSLSSETSLAILGALPTSTANNPYGWTLPPSVHTALDPKRIPDWLHRLGVGVVKLPCWFAPEEKSELDDAAWLVGRLQETEIRTVGLLDHPPRSVLTKIDESERREPAAANYFRDSKVWAPLLEPIMTRLSLKVRTWQLGADNDYSFLGRSQLKKAIKDIGRNLQGFGQPIGVAFSWPWLEPLPPPTEQSWAALNLATSTPLAYNELDAYLQSLESNQSGGRDTSEHWVALDPLDSKTYDLQTRVTDLVLRMTTVRGYRVPATFISSPLDPRQGLLREDWRPNELLLPFRTTSLLLGDLTRTGTLPMRGGSSTVVLANATQTTVVIWNPVPTKEVVYLGDKIRQVDVWGNTIVPKQIKVDGGRPSHEVQVGPMPTFLIDVDPVLVAFRMTTQLVNTNLDSLLGRRQSVSLQFVNPTPELLSGEVRIRPLNDWSVDSRPQAFDVSPGRTAVHEFEVSLRNSAKIGPSQVEFDFLLRTVPPRRFTVTRTVNVGPDGLDLEVTTRLSGGELLVLLSMTNRTTEPMQYDCMMFPPGGRQYQRRQIVIPPGESVKRLFPWEDGASLVGQTMLLRAIEQNGSRVLNQVVEINP